MGRKLKFGKPSKILTVRVPEESFDEIKQRIDKILEEYKTTKKEVK